MRCVDSDGLLKTGALFTARCRRLARLRKGVSGIGGCYVTMGRGNSSVMFLEGVMGNKTSGDCNVRITGLTNIPSLIVSHTGRVMRRLDSRSVAGHIDRVTTGRRATGGGDGTGGCSRISVTRVSLFSAMGSSSMLSRLGGVSIKGLAPVSTLGAVCQLRGGLGGH